VKHIFGTSTGNLAADKILKLLKDCGPTGASRTEIRAVLGSHHTREEVDNALSILIEALLIEGPKYETNEKGGRPKEVWRLKP
jgi:hypothetical protein